MDLKESFNKSPFALYPSHLSYHKLKLWQLCKCKTKLVVGTLNKHSRATKLIQWSGYPKPRTLNWANSDSPWFWKNHLVAVATCHLLSSTKKNHSFFSKSILILLVSQKISQSKKFANCNKLSIKLKIQKLRLMRKRRQLRDTKKLVYRSIKNAKKWWSKSRC